MSDPWQEELRLWEDDNLSFNRNYIGRELHKYKFPYKHGDHIPIEQRYGAMMAHQWAIRAEDKANKCS